jgi:hypothetical protein
MDKVHSTNCKQSPNKQGTYDTRKQRKDIITALTFVEYIEETSQTFLATLKEKHGL